MKFTKVLILIFLAAMTISCATKKAAVKHEAQGEMQTPQEFHLPESPPLPEETEQTKPIKKVEPVLTETQGEEKYILLNFENSDIQTVIATFGELLNINYILTPGISGNVTIQSYNKFPVKNLFQIFQSILEINGLTAVKDGDFYKIIPIDMARQQPIDVDKGREVHLTLDPTFATQLIPLQKVKASDIANILRTLMPRGTDIIVYEPANMLIVTALPDTLNKFVKIVDALDVSESESEAVRTFVYPVEHGEAKKLEEILNAIYSEGKGTSSSAVTSSVTSTTPATTPVRTRRTVTPPSTTPAGSLTAEVGDISITAYEDINALIIKCTPRDYLALLEVLKRIDIPPKQVLIEVVIAEVTLGDSLEYGLEWMIKTHRGDIVGMNLGGFTSSDGTTIIPPDTPRHPGGLAAVVSGAKNDDLFSYIFSTLASYTNVNILASPLVLAADNKEAEIQIGSEVPTATSSTSSTEGITTTAQIQYKTVGTILNVTPHITDKRNVSMKIVIESSDLGVNTTIGTGTYPSFTTRKATTSAVVKDGHSLFIGGLISEKKDATHKGVPFLSEIPILGLLFGGHSHGDTKTELLVMVTPHVVMDQEDADRISKDFRSRVKTIRENLKFMKEKTIKTPEREEEQNKDKEIDQTEGKKDISSDIVPVPQG